MKLSQRGQRIASKLEREFSPSELQVLDESSMHAGHAGAGPEGETHFRIRITAAAFEGKSRLERHRMIYQLLAEELAGGVHALAIRAQSSHEKKR